MAADPWGQACGKRSWLAFRTRDPQDLHRTSLGLWDLDKPSGIPKKGVRVTSWKSFWHASLASMLCKNTICSKWEGHFRCYFVAVASGNAISETQLLNWVREPVEVVKRIGNNKEFWRHNHNPTVTLLQPGPWHIIPSHQGTLPETGWLRFHTTLWMSMCLLYTLLKCNRFIGKRGLNIFPPSILSAYVSVSVVLDCTVLECLLFF